MRRRCDSVLACAAGALLAELEQIAAPRGVHLQATPYRRNAATPLSPEVIMAARGDRGLRPHAAQPTVRGRPRRRDHGPRCPAGALFLRCKNGISHKSGRGHHG
jgi:hypothetical protein